MDDSSGDQRSRRLNALVGGHVTTRVTLQPFSPLLQQAHDVTSQPVMSVRYRTDSAAKLEEKAGKTKSHGAFVNRQVYARPANRLLASLAAEDYAQLATHLRPVKMELGAVLGYGSNGNNFAYFPTTSVISLICDMENGATAEVALAGNDGLVGTSLFLGGNTATNRAVVGIAGEALRLDARILKDHFTRCPAFQRILLRYTETLISQISLTAACNRMHKLEKRLCRWLLLIHDRAISNEFVMTQEFIANMLGGRRETVTVAAGHLQDAGLIHYTRGRLKIIDRAGLENSVCECYRPVANPEQGERSVRNFKYVTA